MIILFINGKQMDLEPNAVIAQTKQVNDVNRLENRQSNYTNTFSLPKTAHNVKVLDYMTIPGNTSSVPYIKNECSLYSSTGECFVYKGWAVVTDAGKTYSVAIVDGIVDLYKAIENKNLSELLDLSELTHNKSMQGILSTWENDLPYRYILADYNGNTGQTNTSDENPRPKVNIDYLVPSVKVSWLWQKIFKTFNNDVQPAGSVFDTFNFKELWMTFPKGQTRDEDSDTSLLDSNDYNFIESSDRLRLKLYYCKFASTTIYNSAALSNIDNNSIHIKVLRPASYRIRIRGKLYGHRYNNATPRDSQIFVGKNCEGWDAWDAINNRINVFGPEINNIPFGENFDFTSSVFQLSQYDSLCFILTGSYNNDDYQIAENNPADQLHIEIFQVEGVNVDFTQALTDFSVKDFMNEIVHRFGLTMFKDKYSNRYEFLTLQEQLQTSNVVDWSNKFSKKVSESYLYGSYAQLNWFRYNYNDKESNHSDWFIQVRNLNLPDSRNVITSKIYSPERVPVTYLDQDTNVYKLWNKEINDDSEVTYTPADKRYYFLRSVGKLQGIELVSEFFSSQIAVYSYRENFSRLKFADILTDYYNPLRAILDNTIIVNAEIWLTDVDIISFDFKKLYYIDQLSNYFIVNKINNYISGKPTKVELLRVKYSEAEMIQLVITGLIIEGVDITISFVNEYPGTSYIQVSTDNINWQELPIFFESPYTMYAQTPGTKYFRLRHGEIYSNTESIIVQ
jgi:hypothetical protein